MPTNPDLLRTMLDRATPIHDSVGRTAFPQPMAPLPSPEAQTSQPTTTIDPYKLSMIGGLMDSASTYAFLKRKTGVEGNAAVAGLSRKSPEALTALGVATNIALPWALKKLGKKFPKIAETIAANQGALQFGYGTNNAMHATSKNRSRSKGVGSARIYEDALLGSLQQDLNRSSGVK